MISFNLSIGYSNDGLDSFYEAYIVDDDYLKERIDLYCKQLGVPQKRKVNEAFLDARITPLHNQTVKSKWSFEKLYWITSRSKTKPFFEW